jgi:uncharacterized protein (TIGR02246 family)
VRIIRLVTLAAGVSLVPGLLEAQGRVDLPQGEVKRINEASEVFTKAVLSSNWKTVASLYAEDAVLYTPGEAAVKGRAAIEACLAAFPAMANFTLRNTRVEGRDDIAYIQGTYFMTLLSREGSEPVQTSGYYVEIRRRQPDGRWLIAVQMLSAHR